MSSQTEIIDHYNHFLGLLETQEVPTVDCYSAAYYHRDHELNVEFNLDKVNFDIRKLGLNHSYEQRIRLTKYRIMRDLSYEYRDLDHVSVDETSTLEEIFNQRIPYADIAVEFQENMDQIDRLHQRLTNNDHLGYYREFTWSQLVCLGW